MRQDGKNKEKAGPSLTTTLLENLRPPGVYREDYKDDVRMLTWNVSMGIKTALGFIVACAFLMINWKTWRLSLPYGEVTIHFPRLVGLSLSEAAFASLGRWRVSKHYKWGMRLVVFAVAAVIAYDLKPGFLHRPFLLPLLLLLWATGLFAFLVCMMWLFQYMRLDRFAMRWSAAAVLLVIVGAFSLMLLLGNWIHPSLGFVLFMIEMFLITIFGFVLVDAFLETIILKWK